MNIICEERLFEAVETKKNPRPGVLRSLQGVFSVSESVSSEDNRNNRLYSDSLLENKIVNSPYTKELISRNCLFGELGHPEDRLNVDILKTSHRVSEMNYGKGLIKGTVEILNTPAGQIADALLEAGAQLAISSRAAGSLEKEGDKTRVIEEDYIFYAYDIVLQPGFGSAVMKPITESIPKPTFDILVQNLSSQVKKMDKGSQIVVEGILESLKTDSYKPILDQIHKDKSVGTDKVMEDALRKAFTAEQNIQTLQEQITSLKKELELRESQVLTLTDDLETAEKQLTLVAETVETPKLEIKEKPLKIKLHKKTHVVEHVSPVATTQEITLKQELSTVNEALRAKEDLLESYDGIIRESLLQRLAIDAETVNTLLPEGFNKDDFKRVYNSLKVTKPASQKREQIEAPIRLDENIVNPETADESRQFNRLSHLVSGLSH